MAESNTINALLVAAQREAPAIDPLDAQILLAWVLVRSRAWLYAHARDPVDGTAAARFLALWRRRCEGEPYAYLVGEREFYGRSFWVTPAVLVPRADTECLLEAALDCWPAEASGTVVDAGTGSGALAVSFALERPQSKIIAIDLSAAALAVAQTNARNLGARVDFVRGSWFDAFAEASIDLLISNPPYLSSDDPHLTEGGLAFEPLEALVAGPAGLEDIEHLSREARRVLRPASWLLFEHGSSQGAAVREILVNNGFIKIETRFDLEGRERISMAQKRARE